MRGFVKLIAPANRAGVWIAVFIVAAAASAGAGTGSEVDSAGTTALKPGAIELGVAGALSNIEGIQSGALWVRAGIFTEALRGLAGAELSAGYSHVSSLDRFDLAAAVNWGKRWGQSGNYPYVSLSGGWRQEEVGSFSHGRFPVGFGIGVRSLVGRRAGFRLEYGYRRVLNDPVADFNEHEITIGLSIYFRNSQNERP